MEETNDQRIPWLAVAGIIMGTFVSALVASSVNVALPKMMAVFGVNADSIQWVVTAYTLTSGMVIPMSGYLCERFGAKRTYISSVIVFTFGCALCAVAWSSTALITARVIQAIGGGIITPVAMIIFYKIVPREKMGMAMGVYGIAIMMAPAIGPTMGGYIIDALNWQWIFIINIPVGIAAFFIGMALLQETTISKDRRADILGIILCSISCFTLLLALSQGQKEGWASLYIVNLFIVAGFSFTLFVIWEFIFPEPLLNLRLLNNQTFCISIAAASLLTIGLYAGSFLIPLYAQNIMGFTPAHTGYMLLPQALVIGVMMPISGRLFDKFGARAVCFAGISITAYYTYQLYTLTSGISFSEINWLLVKRAVGLGLALMPLTTVGMNTIPPFMVSQGSALSNLFRQIAASMGIPILVSLMNNRQVYHSAWLADTVTWSSPVAVSTIKKLAGAFKLFGLKIQAPYTSGAALSILSSLKSKEALICGIQDTFIVAGIITAVAVPLTLFLSRKAEVAEADKQYQRFPGPCALEARNEEG